MKKVLMFAVLAATILTGVSVRADFSVFKNISYQAPRKINAQVIEFSSCEEKLEAAQDRQTKKDIEIRFLACEIGCHQTALAYGAPDEFSVAIYRNNCLAGCATTKHMAEISDVAKEASDAKLEER